MRIDSTNKHGVMQLLKEGKTLYVKSYAGNLAEIWKIVLFGESVIYDDQQGFKCECDVSACIKYNFWDQILCNENGEGVSLEHYGQEVSSAKSTLHKHYDMIVKWASDPGKYQIQGRPPGEYGWTDLSEPSWLYHWEYRIKPEKVLLRQAILQTPNSDKHYLTSDRFSSESQALEFRNNHKFIAWYSPTEAYEDVE